jgi:hypothetical protein
MDDAEEAKCAWRNGNGDRSTESGSADIPNLAGIKATFQ